MSKKFKTIPDKYASKDANYKHVNKHGIDINSSDPVKKFKEWRADYWNNENKINNNL